MGAVSEVSSLFVSHGAKSTREAMRECYNEACEEAEYNYGNDPYNGEINNTSFPRLITPKFRYGSKAFNDWVQDYANDMDKRDCVAIEVPRSHIIKQRPRFKGKKNVRGFIFAYCAPY